MTCWTINVPIPKLPRAYEIQMFLIPPVIIGTSAIACSSVVDRFLHRSLRFLYVDPPRTYASGFDGVERKHGAALSWALVRSVPWLQKGGMDSDMRQLSVVNSGLAKTTTLMVNQPDIARYARSKMAPVWSQLVMFPVASTACAAMGIYATQSIYNAWGNMDWNP